jgi:hypothetical protein
LTLGLNGGQFIIGAVVVVMIAVWVAVIWLMFMDPKQLLPQGSTLSPL